MLAHQTDDTSDKRSVQRSRLNASTRPVASVESDTTSTLIARDVPRAKCGVVLEQPSSHDIWNVIP